VRRSGNLPLLLNHMISEVVGYLMSIFLSCSYSHLHLLIWVSGPGIDPPKGARRFTPGSIASFWGALDIFQTLKKSGILQ